MQSHICVEKVNKDRQNDRERERDTFLDLLVGYLDSLGIKRIHVLIEIDEEFTALSCPLSMKLKQRGNILPSFVQR